MILRELYRAGEMSSRMRFRPYPEAGIEVAKSEDDCDRSFALPFGRVRESHASDVRLSYFSHSIGFSEAGVSLFVVAESVVVGHLEGARGYVV